MRKQFRSAVIAGFSVVFAALLLFQRWWSFLVLGLTMLGIFLFSVGARRSARRSLPSAPQTWAARVGWSEWAWIDLLAGSAAIALYLGAKVGDDIHAAVTSKAALGAVAGVVLVKVIDELASESDFIDEATHSLAKDMFQSAYRGQFQPSGPLPEWSPDRPNQESNEKLAVFFDEMYGGWSRDARLKRAKIITSVSATPGFTWSKPTTSSA